MYMLMPAKCTSYGIVVTVGPALMLIFVFFIIGSAQYATALGKLVSDVRISTSPLPTDQDIVNSSNDNKIMSSSSSIDNAYDANGTPTIVTVSNNRSFLSDATYSISFDPATTTNSNNRISNIITKDDLAADANKVTRGIISIPRSHDNNYLVTQLKGPEGYVSDKLSKIVQISTNQSQKSPTTATFSNDNAINQDQQGNNNSSQIKSITYTAKFECGSIRGSEGPLRPGHYDTDISIFNRQEYPINILLDIVINGGANKTNPIIKSIQPQTSTGIVCKDIRQVLGIGNNNSKGLIDGFVIIRLDVNGGILNSLSSTVGGGSAVISSSPVTINDINNFLDVNVFYTANALEVLPREVVVKDIVFSILNDTSSKIPRSLLMKPLDITVQSQFNEISDPESKVKEILSKEYNLLSSDLPGLHIQILNQSIGAAAMIDDHAISSSVVRPQASS